MARAILQHVLQTALGNDVPLQAVTLLAADGTAYAGTLYDAATGGSVVTSPQSNAAGLVELWTDESTARLALVRTSGAADTKTRFEFDPEHLFVAGVQRTGTLLTSGLITGSGGVVASRNSATNYAMTAQSLYGGLSQILMRAAGTGYLTPPTVSFTGGGGTGAAGTAVLSGTAVASVTVTAAGTGYTSQPSVVFTSGTGSGAAATALVTAPGLQVLDAGGAQAFIVNEISVHVPNGHKLGVGLSPVSANNLMACQWINAEQFYVMNYSLYDNQSVTALSDVAAAAIIGRQTAGDAYSRTLEIDQIAITGTSAGPKLGIELSIEANYVGNGLDRTVGMAIRNQADHWGLATPQRVDSGLIIGEDDRGFVNGIVYMDTLATGYALLFKVDQTGKVTSGHHVPLANGTYDLGTGAVLWRIGYIGQLQAGAGSGAGPTITFAALTDVGLFVPAANVLGFAGGGAETGRIGSFGFRTVDGAVGAPSHGFTSDTNTGMYSGGADILSFTTGGVESFRVTATGVIDYRNVANQFVAVGTTAAATLGNYGGAGRPTAAAQQGWMKVLANGTAVWLPYWT